MSNKILEALKSREWLPVRTQERTWLVCKNCSQIDMNGHSPDCSYAAAIREAERLPKRLGVDNIEDIISIYTGLPWPHCTTAANEIHAYIYREEPDHE